MSKTNLVKVYSTDLDKHHKTGDSWQVTQELADHMEAKGLVTKTEAPKDKKNKTV